MFVSFSVNNNINFQIQKTFCDPEGRFIICDIIEQFCITLTSIYAPNNDNPGFFKHVFEQLQLFKCEELIIGGDYNLVLDINKDKKGGLAKTHHKSVKAIRDHMNELDLVDVWRTLNEDERRYTWRRKNPEVHCRFDFFLASQTLLGNITIAEIVPGYKTDHSMITLNISLHSNRRGTELCRLNTSLLTESDYVNQIIAQIEYVKQDYRGENSINPALLWEMVKLKIREKTISYAVEKKRKITRKKEDTEQMIAQLEKEIEDPLTPEEGKIDLESKLEDGKRELEKIVECNTQGAILRAKVRWYNEGEKKTSYFLGLKKRHCRQGTITQLIKTGDTEMLINTDKEILNLGERFYTVQNLKLTPQ